MPTVDQVADASPTTAKSPEEAARQRTGPDAEIPIERDDAAEPAGESSWITLEEEELSQHELRRRLVQELNALARRLQRAYPDYEPPPFSIERIGTLLDGQAEKMPPGLRRSVLKRLRGFMNEDLFELETWKGVWFMVNYTVEYQGDMLKRRLKGDYVTDEWGMDWEFLELVRPFLDFLYKVYWRVETSGIEHLPDYDRALVVSNHGGPPPWDGLMLMTAVLNEHPAQRLVRNLHDEWVPTLPFLSAALVKVGQALASVENGTRLLNEDELVGAYPEGDQGVGKLFRNRYQLASFGRADFVRMALNTRAPIIPVAVVGAEETFFTFHRSRTLARLTGLPYFPLSLRFPWLGPAGLVPLPSKWYIDFGEPISTAEFGPDAAANLALVSQLSEQTRKIIQEMIDQRLSDRRSPYW
ncbi:MAG: lysophospholipid acyltransferase family protein [Candidatus Promineifilaceae bacterium]|nr:lysophospholipid acyltransferase family protein [Candidatus Promineifilaceae bacterium]